MTEVTGKLVLKCRTTNIVTLFDISLFYVYKFYFISNLTGIRRVNQQVQNYKRCLKNSHFGVEKFNFSLGLSSFFGQQNWRKSWYVL